MVNIDVMARGVQKYTDPETGERFDLPYRVYFPTGYEAKGEKHYPMLFFLHGHGECGTDNEQQIHVLHKENRLLNLVMERDDCIIVAPQCPCNVKYEWVPLAHAWSTGSRELSEKSTIGLAAAMALLDRFLCSEAVDKKRARYYLFYTNQAWGKKENYDLCINTSRYASIKACVPGLAGLIGSLFA